MSDPVLDLLGVGTASLCSTHGIDQLGVGEDKSGRHLSWIPGDYFQVKGPPDLGEALVLR